MRLLRKELPALLVRLEQIPDPRDPKKRRHKLTSLLLYGLLMFVFQFASRRETNREMSLPQFMENLQLLFPEIDTLPHADTLFRLLRDIDLEHLEQAHVDLVKRLIRGKSFRRYLINHCYPIAIDGSQKLAGDTLWEEELLQRTVGRNPSHSVFRLRPRGQSRLPQRPRHPAAQRVPRTRAGRYRSAKAGLRAARL